MAQGASIVGQVLGHYLVLEQIGAGGMGMVFRASDQQLERDVAIKVLPAGLLEDEAARKRFRREALTLAKLNHPNIGTVYEFGSQNGLDFLVMELVGGIGVDAKLGAGPLQQKEVLRLGFQLADGLASAHDHGVIHRDLKPANLRLTQDNRLKILDFGLAQFARKDVDLGITASISENNKVSGTLPYMSPEQLRGEITDPRSDIFSAGAVLYELATGRRPFPSSHVPVLIDSILNREPEPPSVLNPKISPGLEMAILKCLDKEPERRYQSARELRVDLERLSMPVSQHTIAAIQSPPVAAPKKKIKLTPILATSITVLAFIAGTYIFLRLKPTRQSTTSAVNRRRTIAVLNLKNSTARPEAAWLATALPEMLMTELGAGERLRIITGEQVAQMKLSFSLPDSDTLSPDAVSQIGRTLGADLLVLGSYVALADGKLRLDLHLLNIPGGDTLLSVKQTGDENDLFDLISRAGAELRAKCDAGEINSGDQAAVRASLPPTPEASKLYAEGLAKLRVNDAVSARDLLQRAVAADPNHALAHSALAAAWSLLGYDEKARLSAKTAYELSNQLSREEKLLIEARYRETSKEWNNAAESYRTLYGFFPDNLEYGLLLARAQIRGGKGKDALSTVESLRRLPTPDGQDPRIDLTASQAWRFVGDFKQSAASAATAAERARALNTKLLVARALYQQGFALENLNDPNGAMTAVDQASQIYQAVGDRFGLASTIEVAGQVMVDRGDYPGALAKFNEELGVARAVGNRRAESSALNNMALVLSQQGKEEEARKMFEQALSVFQEVGDKNNYAMALINIAGIMKDDGNLTGAKKSYDQALSVSREVNDQSGIALALTGIGTVQDALGDSKSAVQSLQQAMDIDRNGGQGNPSTDKLIDLGDALQHLGDLPNARKNYESALAQARAAGDKSMAGYALLGLGDLEVKAANFLGAHKDYDEALSVRRELGEKDTIAATQVASAELDTEEGHADAAEKMLREVQSELEKAHKNDDEINATAILVDALVAEGKGVDANKEVSKVANLAAHSQNLSAQLAFGLARARAKESSHDTTGAEAVLKEAAGRAGKWGYLGEELESRLLLEELESKSAKSPASRARLTQLQKEAEGKGFNLIAKKAASF